MNAPAMPSDFYPNETEEERIDRWLTLEAEAREYNRREIEKYEEPRMPRWLVGCTNESQLRQYGVM